MLLASVCPLTLPRITILFHKLRSGVWVPIVCKASLRCTSKPRSIAGRHCTSWHPNGERLCRESTAGAVPPPVDTLDSFYHLKNPIAKRY